MTINFRKAFCLLGIAFIFTSALVGCGRKQLGGSGGDATPKPQVIVDTVKSEDVQLYMYVTGQFQPYKEVDVRVRVAGYLEELFFTSGGIIKEGAPLALIEPDQYKVALEAAKAQLEVGIAQVKLAKANLDRAAQLVQSKTISEQDYESARAEYEVAVATVKLQESSVDKAELDLGYTDIKSPITGKMTKNLVDVGNYISPGTASATLLNIAQMDPIFVDFEISDRQFADLKTRMGYRDSFEQALKNLDKPADTPQAASDNASGADLGRIDVSTTTASDVLAADYSLSGKIVTLADNKVNYDSGQITLRGEVRNPLLNVNGREEYLLYAGQICRVRIPHELVKDAVLVHEEAILTDLDTKYVLVVAKEMYSPKDPFGRPVVDPKTGQPIPATEELVIQRRDITLGKLLDTQQRIVVKGLQKGETYVVKGVQRARIGSPVETVTQEDFEKQRAAADRKIQTDKKDPVAEKTNETEPEVK